MVGACDGGTLETHSGAPRTQAPGACAPGCVPAVPADFDRIGDQGGAAPGQPPHVCEVSAGPGGAESRDGGMLLLLLLLLLPGTGAGAGYSIGAGAGAGAGGGGGLPLDTGLAHPWGH